jgi:hypothetical protein
MNEDQWLSGTDPTALLESLRKTGRASDRKLRLFAAASCRRIWPLLVHDVSHRAVEFAESFADGLEPTEELRRVWEVTEEVWVCLADTYRSNPMDPNNEYDAVVLQAGIHLGAIGAAAGAATAAVGGTQGEASLLTCWQYASEAAAWASVPIDAEYDDPKALARERAGQAALLRDLFGPLPFREVCIDPGWLARHENTVRRLAAAIYEERVLPQGTLDRRRLAVLADALEEAGCTNEDVLSHCRSPSDHVRGCWLLDLILGKE